MEKVESPKTKQVLSNVYFYVSAGDYKITVDNEKGCINIGKKYWDAYNLTYGMNVQHELRGLFVVLPDNVFGNLVMSHKAVACTNSFIPAGYTGRLDYVGFYSAESYDIVIRDYSQICSIFFTSNNPNKLIIKEIENIENDEYLSKANDREKQAILSIRRILEEEKRKRDEEYRKRVDEEKKEIKRVILMYYIHKNQTGYENVPDEVINKFVDYVYSAGLHKFSLRYDSDEIIEYNIVIFKTEEEANKFKKEYEAGGGYASNYGYIVKLNDIYYCLKISKHLTDVWGS